jgi:hypothetical protein
MREKYRMAEPQLVHHSIVRRLILAQYKGSARTAVEPTSEEEVDPAEMEERKPSAARLIVGKRKTKEGKQGKGAAKWAAV